MSLRSPLGRVLGTGSAKEGVQHWWLQRLTSVALVPLSIWFVVSLLSLPSLLKRTTANWWPRLPEKALTLPTATIRPSACTAISCIASASAVAANWKTTLRPRRSLTFP